MKTKTLGKSILTGALALTMVFTTVGCGAGNSYSKPMDDTIKSVNLQMEDLEKAFSGESTKGLYGYLGEKLWEANQAKNEAWKEIDFTYSKTLYAGSEMAGMTYEEMVEWSKETTLEQYEMILDELDEVKFSFEEKEAEKIDKDDLEEYQDYLNEYYENEIDALEDAMDEPEYSNYTMMYDFGSDEDMETYIQSMIDYDTLLAEAEVTEGYELKGKIIMEVDGETYETDNMTWIMLKIDGCWTMLGTPDAQIGTNIFDADMNSSKKEEAYAGYLAYLVSSSFIQGLCPQYFTEQ